MEVVVALFILGTAGLLLFAWISQNLAAVTRLRDTQIRAQLQLEGTAWLAVINPVMQPKGELERAGLRMKWRARLVEPMRLEDDHRGNLVPTWRLGLFEVEASITQIESGMQAEWKQLMAGWRSASSKEPLPESLDFQ
jgi:hypothetical protein